MRTGPSAVSTRPRCGGRTSTTSFRERTRDLFRTALERAFREGGETGYEIAGSPDDEQTVLHVLRFGPVKKDGHVVASTLLSIDVSDSHN